MYNGGIPPYGFGPNPYAQQQPAPQQPGQSGLGGVMQEVGRLFGGSSAPAPAPTPMPPYAPAQYAPMGVGFSGAQPPPAAGQFPAYLGAAHAQQAYAQQKAQAAAAAAYAQAMAQFSSSAGVPPATSAAPQAAMPQAPAPQASTLQTPAPEGPTQQVPAPQPGSPRTASAPAEASHAATPPSAAAAPQGAPPSGPSPTPPGTHAATTSAAAPTAAPHGFYATQPAAPQFTAPQAAAQTAPFGYAAAMPSAQPMPLPGYPTGAPAAPFGAPPPGYPTANPAAYQAGAPGAFPGYAAPARPMPPAEAVLRADPYAPQRLANAQAHVAKLEHRIGKLKRSTLVGMGGEAIDAMSMGPPVLALLDPTALLIKGGTFFMGKNVNEHLEKLKYELPAAQTALQECAHILGPRSLYVRIPNGVNAGVDLGVDVLFGGIAGTATSAWNVVQMNNVRKVVGELEKQTKAIQAELSAHSANLTGGTRPTW